MEETPRKMCVSIEENKNIEKKAEILLKRTRKIENQVLITIKDRTKLPKDLSTILQKLYLQVGAPYCSLKGNSDSNAVTTIDSVESIKIIRHQLPGADPKVDITEELKSSVQTSLTKMYRER